MGTQQQQREELEFDVLIVGAGPAGLSCALKLAQLHPDGKLSIAVVEKGSEVGAHILSGAVVETRALDELIPDWAEKGAPMGLPVSGDRILMLTEKSALRIPALFAPFMHNKGNRIISLGNLCRWLAGQAEQLGVQIFPGFTAGELLMEADRVAGVITGDMGLDGKGAQKGSYQPGIALKARYTVFAEGCRGHLGKQLIAKYRLDEGCDPQHYGIGLKEVWKLTAEKHRPGLVMHTAGWPASKKTVSGSFMYHGEDRQAYVGYVVPLSYSNPYLSPYDEFQQWKHHRAVATFLEGGERIAYGSRALIKGGPQSRPRMWFAGGLLIGDNAGTLNFAKIKGTHTAMKSGMLAAETLAQAIADRDGGAQAIADRDGGAQAIADRDGGDRALQGYEQRFRSSWLHRDLWTNRNFGPLLHKLGSVLGPAVSFAEQGLLRGLLPLTLRDTRPDHACLKPAAESVPIEYPKPDGKISFDKLSSVFLSNTNHEEDQPCHLQLLDPELPIRDNLPQFAEPAQRYCPAGVYEVTEGPEGPQFVINAQNCVHCKTCDIKDPAQNIRWVTPEGGGGPNYPNM